MSPATPVSDRHKNLPPGWTYLIHGTDTSRWDVGQAVVTMIKDLSAITLEDRERAARLARESPVFVPVGGFDTTSSYSGRSGEPVEVRVLFLRDDMTHQRVASADVQGLKAALGTKAARLASKYHQDRHPKVPRGEVLVSLGEGPKVHGRRVEYFVPAVLADSYGAAQQGVFAAPGWGINSRSLDDAATAVLSALREMVGGANFPGIGRAMRHELGAAVGFRAMMIDPATALAVNGALDSARISSPDLVRSVGELRRGEVIGDALPFIQSGIEPSTPNPSTGTLL